MLLTKQTWEDYIKNSNLQIVNRYYIYCLYTTQINEWDF